MTSPTSARPDRYGRPARRPGVRAWVVLAVVAVLAGAAWAAWVAWSGTERRIAWTDIGFTVVDDSTTRVVFEVNRDPGRVVVCTVRALNAGYTEVGQVDVTVPASSRRGAGAEATVPTSERAVSGTVKGCVLRD